MLYSIAIHSSLEALLKSTGATLITMSLVNLTEPVGLWLTDVLTLSSDTSLEESGASIACINSIMFARAVVLAYFARSSIENSAWREKVKLVLVRKLENKSTGKCWNPILLFIARFLQIWFHEWMRKREMRKDRDEVSCCRNLGIKNSMEISTGELETNEQEMFPPQIFFLALFLLL